MVGIGRQRHRIRRQHQRFQRAFINQAVNHRCADPGLFGQGLFAISKTRGGNCQDFLARGRQTGGGRAGKSDSQTWPFHPLGLRLVERHSQDHAFGG